MQRGSAQLLLVILILITIAAGGYFHFNQSKSQTNISPVINNETNLVSNIQTFSNPQFNFEFKYPKELTIKMDSEEEFNQRGNGNYRKNFTGYVQYEPGKFLGGVVVLDEQSSPSDKENDFDTNPFTLWVFDNPNDLTIDAWYKNYWYYPFVWGDFTSKGKIELAPKDEATISGTLAKSGVIDYQPGKPKFVYINNKGKMYLFRIINDQGDQILSTFKFL